MEQTIKNMLGLFTGLINGVRGVVAGVFEELRVANPDLAPALTEAEAKVMEKLDMSNIVDIFTGQLAELKSGIRGSDPQHGGLA